MKDKGKLVMLFFIGSEAFFFIALIIAYVYYRNFTDATDTVSQYLHEVKIGGFTSLLVGSSFTLMWSKRSLHRNQLLKFKIGLGITILMGIIFMYGQIKEYIDLYNKQMTISKDIFGSIFFTLTGFHSLHVIIGLIGLSILFGLSFTKFKLLNGPAMRGMEIYWHFVDVVWLFVFFYVYITPLLWT